MLKKAAGSDCSVFLRTSPTLKIFVVFCCFPFFFLLVLLTTFTQEAEAAAAVATHCGHAESLDAIAAATPSLLSPTHRGWNQSSQREHISMNVSGL